MVRRKASVYTRVSTKHEEQLTSLKNQREFYTEYCEKNDYELVKLYVDEGLSATSPNRKAFLELIYDAGLDYVKDENSKEILYFKLSDRQPKFNWIICKDVSRFSRNIDAMKLAKQLSEKKVYILFENAGFSTKDNDWELRLSLLLTFSQQESLDRSKKVGFAYSQRAIKGIYHLTRNLYGYRYNTETKETEIVPEQAENVRKMFELYIEGNGMKNICNYLNERNILTDKGKQWTPRNIRRLFKNEKYIGTVILNRYTSTGITGSNKRIERPKEEWEIHQDAIPRIIDDETWNMAQSIMAKRLENLKEGSLEGTRKIKNIFYNKLYCGKCGQGFTRVSATKKRSYGIFTQVNYICRNRRFYHTCNQKMISHNVLEREINNFAKNELCKELDSRRDLSLTFYRTELLFFEEILIKRIGEIRENIQKQIDEKNNEINNLLVLVAKGSETVINVVNQKIEEIEREKQELELELLHHETVSIENKIQDLKNKLSILEQTEIKNEYTFDEAMTFIKRININDNDIEFITIVSEEISPVDNLEKAEFDQKLMIKFTDKSSGYISE